MEKYDDMKKPSLLVRMCEFHINFHHEFTCIEAKLQCSIKELNIKERNELELMKIEPMFASYYYSTIEFPKRQRKSPIYKLYICVFAV